MADAATSRLKRVAITGASGFVGRALCARFLERGYHVIALGRDLSASGFSSDVERRTFDPNASEPNETAFAGADAAVHLAGETVAGRWTKEKKRAIYESRVNGTRAVVASLAAAATRPRVLVTSSASGYYGSRGDQALDESAAPGDDFLARVCVDWEREARAATGLGVRSVQIRTGIVLGAGGALDKMTLPFKLGAGGPFGSGKQFVPWIALDDLVELYLFALEHDDLAGPINGVAPDYATSARFAQALGMALHRPALVPAPAFALKLGLGQFSSTLLASQLVLPAAAEDAGFAWRYPVLEDAMRVAVGSPSRTILQKFEAEQTLPLPLESVFAFFSDAGNLEAITPPALRFKIRSLPRELQRGAQIAYDLRLRGVPIKWKTMIASWDPPHGFDDVQLHGPYALWHHRHRFAAIDGAVVMRDEVTYALPYYPFGNAALPLVRSDIAKIFAFRREAIAKATTEGHARA